MKANILITLIAAAVIILGAGCSKKDDNLSRTFSVPVTTNSAAATPREAAAIADVINLRNKANAMEQEIIKLQKENTDLALRLAAIQAEYSTASNNLVTVQTENDLFARQCRSLQVSNSILSYELISAKLSNTVASSAQANTPAPASAITSSPTPATTTPAVNPASVAVPASANIIAVVTTSKTNSVIFYVDGTVVKTNTPIGMVGGFPILVDNVSKEIIVLTVSRVPGPGSISLEVLNSTYLTLSLLEAEYKCSWRIKGEYKLAGSDTLNVRGGPPSDLVVGKGVFNGTLTLVDK